MFVKCTDYCLESRCFHYDTRVTEGKRASEAELEGGESSVSQTSMSEVGQPRGIFADCFSSGLVKASTLFPLYHRLHPSQAQEAPDFQCGLKTAAPQEPSRPPVPLGLLRHRPSGDQSATQFRFTSASRCRHCCWTA